MKTIAAILLLAVAIACGPAYQTPAEPPPTEHRQQRTVAIATRTLEQPVKPPRQENGIYATARRDLAKLDIAEPDNGGKAYNRTDWISRWDDADNDRQNTRAEVLIQESLTPVQFATDQKRRVVGGYWIGPWSKQIYNNAADLEIDHHVPLAHAHYAGGWKWDEQKKQNYANDLDLHATLQAIDRNLNRAKGASGPHQWLPPNRNTHCRYAADWVAVKTKWQLTVAPLELRTLQNILNGC